MSDEGGRRPEVFYRYSPAGLYCAAQRFSSGWTVEDVVEEFMHLHPDADRAEVEREVRAAAGP